jgi:hypothetical protein
MRARAAVLSASLVLLLYVPSSALFAQKVTTNYDKNAHFAQYKRYTWGKNSLVTRQMPEVEAAIEKSIVTAADRELANKGFVKDGAQPDFIIHYNAGGMPDPKANVPTATYSTAGGGLYSTPMYGATIDVWMQVIAGLHFEVQDAATKSTVWQSTATKTIKDTKKFAKNLQKEIDEITKKSLQSFPPK